MQSKVYLTGAGAGDVELLTLKAARVIKEADIIIYDKLANPEILNMANENCEFIFVGKESGHHMVPQETINEIIYQSALKYQTVVRLKGGDPFVFGRGAEEALYLRERNIAFEIIPGISSSIAVPAYAGIPVTHRGITTSFRVVTGHETPDKKISQIEWESFLNDETIVFLMGLHKIDLITSKLLSLGKREDYPCAVISRGTTKDQKVVVGTLKNIASLAKDLPTPGIIVVGEVVKLREEIKWFD